MRLGTVVLHCGWIAVVLERDQEHFCWMPVAGLLGLESGGWYTVPGENAWSTVAEAAGVLWLALL